MLSNDSSPWDAGWRRAARLLSKSCGVSLELLRRRLADPKRTFVWIKRWLSEADEAKVDALMDVPLFKPGKRDRRARLGFKTEFARRYPLGTLAAHILAFRTQDPGSHEGIERLLSENTLLLLFM